MSSFIIYWNFRGVNKKTEYIANIYSYAVYSDFTITFEKEITDLINVDDELKILLDNKSIKKNNHSFFLTTKHGKTTK
jgi:hypothetical protein